MFKDTKAYSSFSTDTIDNIRNFYTNILGLEVETNAEMGMEYFTLKLATGGTVMVYPKGEGHMPAEFTVLNFPVTDVVKAVEELKSKGVQFEHYDNEYIKMDDRNIAQDDKGQPYIAWFKDPAGNILAVMNEK